MIEAIEDIQRLVCDGFDDWISLGDVKVVEYADFLLFNYTAKAQYTGRWNPFERMSRGLIINRVTGEIVARPFDKFFNWGERGMKTDAPIVSVAEKMDGSLGIGYWDTETDSVDKGIFRIATRGSFTSGQAMWATKWIHSHIGTDPPWPQTLTYLFEIVYPQNRIVVDYGQRKELVLLAIRSSITGGYLSQNTVNTFADKYNLSRPRNYINLSPDELTKQCATLPASEEGYVATFSDGSIFKFKGAAYCELHKLISGLSFKSALEAVASGTVDSFREVVPDEFLGEFNSWVAEIEQTAMLITDTTEIAYTHAPKDSRKDYAAYINANAPQIASYAFLRLDNKPLLPAIYKQAFRERV